MMLDREKTGHFLLELRRSKDFSPEEVAKEVGVSSDVVANWERGSTLPQTNYIKELADLYGVSVNEILRGEKYSPEEPAPSELEVTKNILDYANKNASEQFKHTRREWLIAITGVLAFVSLAFLLIDFISANSITWSGIASVSMLFAWGIILPLFFRLTTPVMSSLIAFSILIIPYLFLLNMVIQVNNILVNVAIPITALALLYLWAIYFVYQQLHLALFHFLAVCAFGLVPVVILVNLVISREFNVPLFTIWNIIGLIILIGVGVGLIYLVRKRKIEK